MKIWQPHSIRSKWLTPWDLLLHVRGMLCGLGLVFPLIVFDLFGVFHSGPTWRWLGVLPATILGALTCTTLALQLSEVRPFAQIRFFVQRFGHCQMRSYSPT